MSNPSPIILHQALQRIQGDLGHRKEVARISLSTHAGKPAIIITGRTPQPPVGFPPAFLLRINGDPYMLPLIWRMPAPATKPVQKATPEEDLQLDLDMWGGAPEITDHPMKLWTPEVGIAQGANKQEPVGGAMNNEVAIEARIPQFVTPNFWAKYFHRCGETCLGYYGVAYNMLQYTVPSDYLLIIDGISYEFSDLIPFDQFDIRVLKNGAPMNNGTFRDMRAPTASVDPAEQYCFGGHYRPIPFYGRFDHDETMSIQVIVYGPYPFQKTTNDKLGGCVKVCTTGWLGSLMDNRDGGARPVDMGEMNDMALGDVRGLR